MWRARSGTARGRTARGRTAWGRTAWGEPAVAQAVRAAVDVDPKAPLPPAVRAAIDEIRGICDVPGSTTRIEPGGLMRADINADGAPDDMISSYGIECPAGLMLYGAHACEVQVFASTASGDYEAADVLLGDRYSFDVSDTSAPFWG
ncbi:MAG: hypothetical protein ACFE0R_10025 [Salinarimonas sp.]